MFIFPAWARVFNILVASLDTSRVPRSCAMSSKRSPSDAMSHSQASPDIRVSDKTWLAFTKATIAIGGEQALREGVTRYDSFSKHGLASFELMFRSIVTKCGSMRGRAVVERGDGTVGGARFHVSSRSITSTVSSPLYHQFARSNGKGRRKKSCSLDMKEWEQGCLPSNGSRAVSR